MYRQVSASPAPYIRHVCFYSVISRDVKGTLEILGNFLHKHKDCAEKFIWPKKGINR